MCFLFFHKWQEWEFTFTGFLHERGFFSESLFARYQAIRTCSRCHRFQYRDTDERELDSLEKIKQIDRINRAVKAGSLDLETAIKILQIV